MASAQYLPAVAVRLGDQSEEQVLAADVVVPERVRRGHGTDKRGAERSADPPSGWTCGRWRWTGWPGGCRSQARHA